ncbi:MAG: hypothetical protein IPP11_12940 [Chitinophagaceae bacterium]|nr:hypothetical protein [Chitinophagaceae bacterium]
MFTLKRKEKFPDYWRIFLPLIFSFLVVFDVQAQDVESMNIKNPFQFHGNVNLQLDYYKANGISARQKEFSWLINGNPVLTVLGVDIPLSFVLSNFENKFYQPFNQFGISPKYKWATLHLGYRNLTYSNYTLAGHRILGAGFDLKPKNFRIGFMYGQLRRSASIDSSMNANPMYVRPAPTYKRLGMAAKLGYSFKKIMWTWYFSKAGIKHLR